MQTQFYFKVPSRLTLIAYCLFLFLGGERFLSLLEDVELDALSAGERDPRLVVTDHEHVAGTSGEGVTLAVLQVGDLEATVVFLTRSQDTNAALVGTSGDHAQVTGLELDNINGLAGGQVELDGVAGLGERVGEADGAAIVSDSVRHGTRLSNVTGVAADGSLFTLADLDDAAELVLSFGVVDAVDGETSLDIVQQTELLVGLLDGDHIHEAGRVVDVGADFVINLYKASHDNLHDLTASQGILQSVSEDQSNRKRLTELVRTGGRARSPSAAELVKHPVPGGI